MVPSKERNVNFICKSIFTCETESPWLGNSTSLIHATIPNCGRRNPVRASCFYLITLPLHLHYYDSETKALIIIKPSSIERQYRTRFNS